jgi:ligand-binding sensor domain-containing protein
LERTTVTDIKGDAGGKVWVAATGGIYILGKDGAVHRIAKKDGLPNEWVNALPSNRAPPHRRSAPGWRQAQSSRMRRP